MGIDDSFAPGRTVDLAAAVAGEDSTAFDLAPCFPVDESPPGRRAACSSRRGPSGAGSRRAPRAEAHRELLDRLDGRQGVPRWIIGPGHGDYAVFADQLARSSGVPGTVVSGA